MNLWLTIVLAGLVTFAIRLSFIALLGHGGMPGWMRRALRFVPPAVLCAIIFPALLLEGGSLTLGHARLAAGLAAIVVAWFSKNVVLTIAIGMLALIGLQALGL